MLRRLLPPGITRRIEAATALTALLGVALSTGAALPLLLTALQERETAQVNLGVASVSRGLGEAQQMLWAATQVAALDPGLGAAVTKSGQADSTKRLTDLAAVTGAHAVTLTDREGRVVARYLRGGKRAAEIAERLQPKLVGETGGVEFGAGAGEIALHSCAPLAVGGQPVGVLHLLSSVGDRLALALRGRLPPDWEVFFVQGGKVVASSAPDLLRGARLGPWRKGRQPVLPGTLASVVGGGGRYDAMLLPLWGGGQVVGFWGLTFSPVSGGATLSWLLQGILVIALASLLLALVVGRRQARVITAGLARLSREVDRVRAGDLDVVGPGGPARDEVEVLAAALAEMASELKRSFAELSAERRKLQALVDRMAEGVALIDDQRRVVFLNPTGRKMLSLEGQERPGFEALPSELQQALAESLEHVQEMEIEMQPEAAAGRYFRVRLASVLVGPDTKGAMAVLTDITRYRELDEMKTDFIGYVAHELRNPLTVIKGFAELLLTTGEGVPEDYHDMLQAVSLHSDRLNDLVESLLELTRLESGAPVTLSKETVQLDKMLTTLVTLYRAYGSGHEFVLELPEGGISLQGDADRIGLIFSNLLSNAVKYTPQGTRVIVRGSIEQEVAVVEVADNGPGMTAEHLRNIFDKFYRAPSAVRQKKRGSGIGLYLVKRLAEAHRGTVEAASAPEQGTTFTVRLPLA